MRQSSCARVSVVMSVHGGARFLREAIASILAQTLTDLELIVVNDGSLDDTSRILRALTDRRVRVIEQPHLGLAAALNRGIAAAGSDLIARMDADDISLPVRLEKQCQYLESHPRVALLGTAARVVSESGAELDEWHPPADHDSIRHRLIRANQFAHASVMFRKEAFLVAGGYRENMPFAQDYDLWLRMVPRFETANLAEVLLVRRVGPDQFGTARETRQIRWALRARIRAIRRGDYPVRDALALWQPLLSALLPGAVRQLGRRVLGRDGG